MNEQKLAELRKMAGIETVTEELDYFGISKYLVKDMRKVMAFIKENNLENAESFINESWRKFKKEQ